MGTKKQEKGRERIKGKKKQTRGAADDWKEEVEEMGEAERVRKRREKSEEERKGGEEG